MSQLLALNLCEKVEQQKRGDLKVTKDLFQRQNPPRDFEDGNMGIEGFHFGGQRYNVIVSMLSDENMLTRFFFEIEKHTFCQPGSVFPLIIIISFIETITL